MDIKLLQDELEQTLQRRSELRGKYSGTVLPAEAATEDANLHERGMKLRQAIEEEKVKERDRDFAELGEYFTDPTRHIPHASINADDAGRKSLAQSGWKIANGVISRETTLGEYPMYAEEVLFGPTPRDATAQEYFKLTRMGFQPEYRAAWMKYMVQVAITKDTALALNSLSATEQKALSEGQDSAGGFLVPPDIQAEIFARTAQQAVMRGICRTVNTSRDRIVWPRLDPAAATAAGLASGGASVFSSAFIGTWAAEVPSASDVDPVWGTIEINVKKLRVQTRMSNDFIADAIADIPAFLATDGARNMGLVEDQGFLLGQTLGHPQLEPLGILIDTGITGATVDLEGSTADTISNTAAAPGSAPKLINQVYALPSQYAGNARWLMKRTVEGKIRGLVGGNGGFLWPLQSGSMFGPPNGIGVRSLMEYPVHNSDFMAADGANGAKVALFGDFSNYLIAQRAMITSTVLRERYADTDQTGIILWERAGGACVNPDAFRLGVV